MTEATLEMIGSGPTSQNFNMYGTTDGGMAFRLEHDTNAFDAVPSGLNPDIGSSRGDFAPEIQADGFRLEHDTNAFNAEPSGLTPDIGSSRGNVTEDGANVILRDDWTTDSFNFRLEHDADPIGTDLPDALNPGLDSSRGDVVADTEPDAFALPDLRGVTDVGNQADGFRLEHDADPFQTPLELSTFEEMWVV